MVNRAILAAGHGGGDPGSTGQGTTEAAECIQIVNRTADKLRADGRVEVIIVPHELGLIDAINWINARYKNLEDGICLEVHKNATIDAHGIETWYWGGDSQSQALAQKLQDGIMSVSGMPVSRGIKGDNTNRWGSLGFIRDTNPWALLVEMGFVSNGGDPVDDAADDRYAEGVYRGILRVLGLPPKPVSVPVNPPTPTPTPPPVQVAFRVYNNEKQIGAYNTEINAWMKYRDAGGVRITNSKGEDITAYFVNKYRPQEPPPVVPPVPHPEYEGRISALETIVKSITDFLDSLFKNWRK